MKYSLLLLVLFLTCNCLCSQSNKHIAEYKSVVGNTYLIMKDILDNTYHVHGDIEKLGTLVIFFNKNSKSGNKTYLTIQGATRVGSNRTNESAIAFSTGSLN